MPCGMRLVVPEGPIDLSGEGRIRERAQEKSKPPPSQWGEKKTERSLGKSCQRDTGELPPPWTTSSRHFAPGNFHFSRHEGRLSFVGALFLHQPLISNLTFPATKAAHFRGGALPAPTPNLKSHVRARRAAGGFACPWLLWRRRTRRAFRRSRSTRSPFSGPPGVLPAGTVRPTSLRGSSTTRCCSPRRSRRARTTCSSSTLPSRSAHATISSRR
jgi:hypothetical protein